MYLISFRDAHLVCEPTPTHALKLFSEVCKPHPPKKSEPVVCNGVLERGSVDPMFRSGLHFPVPEIPGLKTFRKLWKIPFHRSSKWQCRARESIVGLTLAAEKNWEHGGQEGIHKSLLFFRIQAIFP